jgi:hypothetical protein
VGVEKMREAKDGPTYDDPSYYRQQGADGAFEDILDYLHGLAPERNDE